MTGLPIRHTQFADWIDPDAWMETMKGPRWNKLLKEEAAIVLKETEKPVVKKRLGAFVASIETAQESNESIPFQCGDNVSVYWHSQFIKTWHFKNEKKIHEARDLVCEKNKLWITRDVGKGAESFELAFFVNQKVDWKVYPVGPEVGIVGDKLYYLGVKNKLIYHELWSCDKETGKNKKLVYQEKQAEVNLSLEKQPDGVLVLVRDNSQDVDYYTITEISLIKRKSRFEIPVSWKIPSSNSTPEFVWKRLHLLVTKQHGAKTLWKCGPSSEPKKLLDIPSGQILIDPFASWQGNNTFMIRIVSPHQNTQFYKMDTKYKISAINPIVPTGLQCKRYQTKSKDGTIVHGILIYKALTHPKYLLMIGYGAYGLETGATSVLKRWTPLVQNEWAIGYTFIRGGGDHTEEWGKVGRCDGRQKTIEDFQALVKSAQNVLNISPKHTAIYGRSAGGLLMGNTLSNNPKGELMSAVYTEVPYVDELRTTTNTELPLTVLEYNEFGSPLQRLKDFIYIGLTSPADSAAVTASPSIFVLTRTAENDSQVFAYESVKWIQRLRSHDKRTDAPKLCIVEKGQGHFTPPDQVSKQWALDLALLDAWIKGAL
jgi:prolyl oligopeptidase PreP (S9A serine peptidase family)